MAGSFRDLMVAFLNRAPGDDYFITGGPTRSTLGDNLLAAAGSAAIDTMALGNGQGSAHSFYIQVNGSSGISAGAITVEASNDNTNFTAIPYFDGASSSASWTAAAMAVAASTSRFLWGATHFRYLRVRISTAFAGGTVSAMARLSTAPLSNGALTAQQATAANLKTAAILTPQGSGGNSIYSGAVTNTATQVKSGAGQVYGYDIHNPNASIVYLQFFDTAVGSVTVGSTTPKFVLGIPANGRAAIEWPNGIQHTTAIVIAATTTRGGSTAPGTAVDVNVIYT
jgi:hypothetical protein